MTEETTNAKRGVPHLGADRHLGISCGSARTGWLWLATRPQPHGSDWRTRA